MSKEKVELSKSEPHGPTLPRALHPAVGISGDGWKNRPESAGSVRCDSDWRFPGHLRSSGSHGESCVEQWEHLGVGPESSDPRPLRLCRELEDMPDLGWEAPFLEVEISGQEGLTQPW